MLEADHQTCPSCGEPVTTVVAGLCPRCLLGNALGGETRVNGGLAPGETDETRANLAAEVPTTPRDSHRQVRIQIDDTPAAVHQASPRGLVPADRTAHLTLFGEIGRGGMGVVLRGRDPDLGRDLAVKVLRDELRDSPEMVRRFVEEAQIAGQLQHPGIVPIYELGTMADKRPFFAMKLVKGRTLSQLLAEGKPTEADRTRALGIFEQVCQTVAYAHAHGVIHRDLKPSNVMVGSFGEVQVMDWGLAKVLRRGGGTGDDVTEDRVATPVPETVIATARSLADSDLSSAGSVLGTPSYMAPEQARGEVEAIDERADVFALGSILCEILSGQPAFTGPRSVDIQRRAADGDLSGAWLRLDSCGADPELLALARECLAPDRAQRPRDAGVVAGRLTAYLASVQERLRAAEVARAAESARAEEATRTTEVARGQARAERRARRLTGALAAAGVGLIALIGGGAAWLQRQDAARTATTTLLVNDALAEALRREGEARTRAIDDPAGWDAALAEAHRADDLLKQGRANAALRGRVSTVLAALAHQREQAAQRAEALKIDRKLVAELGATRNRTWTDLNLIDRGYAAAFLAAGLDVDRTEPSAIGDWVAARPARDDIVVYLDDWVHIRRSKRSKPTQHTDADLVAAARVADPDPWRDRLRAAHKDPTALRALADDEPGLENQPARSLHLLAIALKDEAKDWDRGMRVLRLAWRKFPDDFWINIEMSVFVAVKSRQGPPAERTRWKEERVRFLTAAVAARPQSDWVLFDLGDLLADLDRYDDALEAYRGATRLRPGTAPYTRLGLTLQRQKKDKEAEAAFREAIRANPDDAVALVELGIILREQKKFDASLAHLRKAIQLEPENARTHYYYGWSFQAAGKSDDAIAAYREAFRIDCKNKQVGSVAYALAEYLRWLGRADEAIVVLDETLQIKPDEVKAHEALADILARQRRWPEALTHITEASRLAPANDHVALQAAVLYLYTGDDAGYRRHCLAMLDRYGTMINGTSAGRAITSCLLSPRPVELERATKLRQLDFERRKASKPGTPDYDWSRRDMALAEHRNGRFERADELLKEVRATGGILRLLVDSLRALNCLSLGQQDEGRRRLAECKTTLQAGIEAFGEPVNWHDWLICEMFCREAEALIPEGTTPGENGPPRPPPGVHYPRIKSLVGAGRHDEAIVILREAVSRKPDDARAQATLGDLLAQRGRWEEASKVLGKAAELDSSAARLWLQTAILHLYLGDDASYQRYSRPMIDRFEMTMSGCVTMGCLLSTRPIEFKRVYQLAKRDYNTSQALTPAAEHYGWAEVDWALAEYREGHFDSAVAHLKKCRAAGGVIGLVSESLLAMSYQHLGLKAESGRLLTSCRATLREVAASPSGWGSDWHAYLICEMFCREAEVLIRNDAARRAEGKLSGPPTAGAGTSSAPASGNKP